MNTAADSSFSISTAKFFSAPCFYDMKASATVADCEACRYGTVSEDRMRVFCDRI